jgi:hypothetical protein
METDLAQSEHQAWTLLRWLLIASTWLVSKLITVLLFLFTPPPKHDEQTLPGRAIAVESFRRYNWRT